jgi:hypothetical protein
MFAFDLLGMSFPDGVVGGRQVTLIDASGIGVKVDNPKGLEQGLQLLKDCIGPGAQGIGQDRPREVINRVPQPALVRFAPDKTPPLIHLRSLHSTHLYRDRFGTAPLNDGLVDRLEGWGLFFSSSMTVVGLICRTRAISRTPLPLSVISTIWRFTWGKRP